MGALDKYGISDAELAAAIAADGQVNAALNKFMRDEVIPYAKSISPVDEGDYAAAWEIVKKSKRGRGAVGNRHWRAHMIEYGTKADTKKGSPLGPDTPTPAFAVRQKVSDHFGGKLRGDGVEF